jgi:hypothetical protein
MSESGTGYRPVGASALSRVTSPDQYSIGLATLSGASAPVAHGDRRPPLRSGGSLRPQESGPLYPGRSSLCVKPPERAGDLSLVRHVLTTLRVVGLSSAAPADRHTSVRLRRMMLVKPSAEGGSFGRDHGFSSRAPDHRPTPSPKDHCMLGGEQVSAFSPP